MIIKLHEQSGSKCFLCKKVIEEDGETDQAKLSSFIQAGEKLITYYLIGKVRAGKRNGNGIVLACESCWIEYAGFSLEDEYDKQLKDIEILDKLARIIKQT